MSGTVLGSLAIGGAFTALATNGNPLAYIGDALFSPMRLIGTVVPNVTIEEVNRDELEITSHPVEFGSPITDHSYKRPMELNLHVGWDNSGHYPGYVDDIYDALLDLQASRIPFSVFTGKRTYSNMLFASLIQTSNSTFGDFTLIIQATLREIIIVSTSAVQVPATSQTTPEKTADTHGHANQQPQHVTPAVESATKASSANFNGVSILRAVPVTGGVTQLLGFGGA